MKNFIIFGVSAFLSDIMDLIHGNNGKVYKIYMNMKETKRDRAIGFQERVARLGYEVEIHKSLDSFQPEDDCAYTLGTPSPQKFHLVEELKTQYNLTFQSLIHPTVYLGSHVQIGEGVQINVNTTISPGVCLNDFCTLNRNVSIGHDTHVGKYTLIGPGVTIGGSGQVDEKSTIGMGACIFDQIHIGPWAVVGAGSLVTKDVESETVVYGSPAKPVRRNDDANLDTYKMKRNIIKRESV